MMSRRRQSAHSLLVVKLCGVDVLVAGGAEAGGLFDVHDWQ
jgi:NAD(P)H-dependent flavin oxidoreductase YrpB (nitropropane dioxygenase family)